MPIRLLPFISFLLLLLTPLKAFATYSVEEVPNVHLNDSTRYVSNPAGVLSPQAVAELDRIIASMWRTSTAEVVVVAIDSADTDDLDTYATKLFEKWGIGKSDKDNGLLVLISRDQRRAVIRTGQGMEGVMPDVYASRIIRNVMAPSFKEEDYDSGTINAVNAIAKIVNNPEAASELISSQPNNARVAEEMSLADFFRYYFYLGIGLTIGLLIAWIAVARNTRGQSAHKKYDELKRLRMPSLMLAILGCGLPLIVFWLVGMRMRRLRDKPRLCPSCHTRMNRLDEETDNLYLTAPQNTEEMLNTVDYDVWLCPKCQATTVEPYVNRSSTYETCELCHTRAARQVANRVLRQPTVAREGQGARVFHCRHCGKDYSRYYPIAKLPPVVIIPSGGRGGGGGFGGGFSGGSFGGGSTMGGGASGGW